MACAWMIGCGVQAQKIFQMKDYGIRPDQGKNVSAKMQKAISKIKSQVQAGEPVVLRFEKGRYDFYPEGAAVRRYYISNHDQTLPKYVGLDLEQTDNWTIDGGGADFVFHGTMVPLALVQSTRCHLKNFSIDFANPHIAQIKIVANRGAEGMLVEPAPWVQYRVTPDSVFQFYGEGWEITPSSGIAFEGDTRHVVYRTGDIFCPLKGVSKQKDGLLLAPRWVDARLKAGTVVALRSWDRPTPGIFLSESRATKIDSVQVHYAQGMGLVAQLCDSVALDHFNVCLRSDKDPRYFTTQADATHFSQCKGLISSVNGLYEGMMDDAINVHGIYLKVTRVIDDHTLVARYMHDQAWGFKWGEAGDEISFVASATMEPGDKTNRIVSMEPEGQEKVAGTRAFRIRVAQPLDDALKQGSWGIENLSWTPEVHFADNTIRNNRARGALFSTPRRTVVERNFFDHTSGSAILLCGDCNGWYETGACRDVVIRENCFVNALTSPYQFTEAVISIYPEIPDLKGQKKYFHGGRPDAIVIENNEFDTFDKPLLYIKSVDGLIFRNNKIRQNNDYPAYHPNQSRYKVLHSDRIILE